MNVTVLMSGGIDSAACTHYMLERGHKVSALFVDFGQASAKWERQASKKLCKYFKIPLIICKARSPRKFGIGELTGRNAFLIFSALLLGGCREGILALGIHSGTPYFDCSLSFLTSISQLVAEHTDGVLQLVIPFSQWTKSEVFEYFRSCDLPVELAYSCESGTKKPCGECASCKDRTALSY